MAKNTFPIRLHLERNFFLKGDNITEFLALVSTEMKGLVFIFLLILKMILLK